MFRERGKSNIVKLVSILRLTTTTTTTPDASFTPTPTQLSAATSSLPNPIPPLHAAITTLLNEITFTPTISRQELQRLNVGFHLGITSPLPPPPSSEFHDFYLVSWTSQEEVEEDAQNLEGYEFYVHKIGDTLVVYSMNEGGFEVIICGDKCEIGVRVVDSIVSDFGLLVAILNRWLLQTKINIPISKEESPKEKIVNKLANLKLSGRQFWRGGNVKSLERLPILVVHRSGRNDIQIFYPRRNRNLLYTCNLDGFTLIGYVADRPLGPLGLFKSQENLLVFYDGVQTVALDNIQLTEGTSVVAEIARVEGNIIIVLVERGVEFTSIHRLDSSTGIATTLTLNVRTRRCKGHVKVGPSMLWFDSWYMRLYIVQDVFTQPGNWNVRYFALPQLYRNSSMISSIPVGGELRTLIRRRQGDFRFGRILVNGSQVNFPEVEGNVRGVNIYVVANGKGFQTRTDPEAEPNLFIAKYRGYHCTLATMGGERRELIACPWNHMPCTCRFAWVNLP